MSKKKKEQVHCIFFVKKKFRKDEIIRWCKENKEKYNIKKIPCKSELNPRDKDYKLTLRNKARFKRTRKKTSNGIKIVMGYLK